MEKLSTPYGAILLLPVLWLSQDDFNITSCVVSASRASLEFCNIPAVMVTMLTAAPASLCMCDSCMV